MTEVTERRNRKKITGFSPSLTSTPFSRSAAVAADLASGSVEGLSTCRITVLGTFGRSPSSVVKYVLRRNSKSSPMVTLKGPSKVATITFSKTRLVTIVKSKTKNRLPIINHVFSRYLHASARTAAQIFSGLDGGVDRLSKQTLRGSRGGVEDTRLGAKDTKKIRGQD